MIQESTKVDCARASHQAGRWATRPRWAWKASRVKEPVREVVVTADI